MASRARRLGLRPHPRRQGCHGIGRSGRHDVACAVTLVAMVVAAGTKA